MSIKKITLALCGVFFVMAATFTNNAYAEGDKVEHQPFFEKRYNWMNEPEDYSPPQLAAAENAAEELEKTQENQTQSSFSEKDKFKNDLIDRVPYGDDLAHMWDVVDGEVDIVTIEGLRVDRRNKGMNYTTSTIPMIGTIDGLELEFSAGDTNEFAFESKILPFVGQIEGFKLKGSTNNDRSKIFARYTIAFD